MRKTVRNVSLASLLFLLTALGCFYLGERQRILEKQHIEEQEKTSGFTIFDAEPDTTNAWHTIGFVFFLLSVSVALGAYFLWCQEEAKGGSGH